MRVVWVRLAAALAVVLSVGGAAGAEIDGPISFVPWKVLAPGEAPPDAPLILYWIPASPSDFKHSDLLISRPLTLYASQCVAMKVVRPDDSERIASLGGPPLPAAILVEGDGRRLGSVAAERGVLRVRAVERLVRDKLAERDMSVESQLDEARKKASSGDRQGAIAAYRAIWSQRCLFPRHGREAQRALKRLGVEVAESGS